MRENIPPLYVDLIIKYENKQEVFMLKRDSKGNYAIRVLSVIYEKQEN